MSDKIQDLFLQLNSEDGPEVELAISELSVLGIIIDRDTYFSWDTVN